MFARLFKKKITQSRLERATGHEQHYQAQMATKKRAKEVMQRLEDKKRQR